MVNRRLAYTTLESPELQSVRHELQEEAILLALPSLYIVGLGLILMVGVFQTALQGAILGLALLVMAGAVWLLRRANYLAAACLLVTCVFVVTLLTVIWADLSPALGLLALPVGLATLLIGMPAGIVAALGASALIAWMPPELLVVARAEQTSALVTVWGVLWLVWLNSRAMLTVMTWFRMSHEQSRLLLEEARDRQLQLGQSLHDLADANLQLSRLHRFANSMRQLAEDARRTKEQFVANVSHELRTPLNMIIGFTEMILQAPHTYGYNVPQALLADLEIVQRNSQQLSGLIDDVLDLSHIETGQMALTKEMVHLDEIVDAAVTAVRPLFDSKRLSLTVELADALPPLFCDPLRIRQVLLNLLSNAGRFTDKGSVVVRAYIESAALVVGVADTGPGIAESDVPKLFLPFQQLDSSTRRKHGGSGLGLNISKAFIELHGGQMWVESQAGSGATFFFRLPLAEPIAAGDGATRWLMPYSPYEERWRRPSVPVQRVRPRIVVLESGHALQRMVARYLNNAQVVPVTSLDAALTELAAQPAHALLVNHLDVVDQLRHLESAPIPFGTPALVCSVPGTIESADRLGVFHYLVKPVQREDLLDALERLAAQGHALRTLLVVDDDRDALRLFRRMLASARQEYRVIRAGNGEQALYMLEKERPDVVLLDLIMPHMDGFRFLEAKNRLSGFAEIPVIVLSAQDPAGQPVICKSLGITRGGGISARRLLAAIEALTQVLAPQRVELRVQEGEEGAALDGFAQEG